MPEQDRRPALCVRHEKEPRRWPCQGCRAVGQGKSGRSGYDPIAPLDINAPQNQDASMNDLLDAYGNPFDPSPFVARWQRGERDEAVGVLWDRLHNQGDVGSASFAAVPDLIELIASQSEPDWNAYALIAAIEEARVCQGELLPAALASGYSSAWKSVLPLALRDLVNASQDELVRSLIAVIAHAKGQHSLGVIALCTEDERAEMLGWDTSLPTP